MRDLDIDLQMAIDLVAGVAGVTIEIQPQGLRLKKNENTWEYTGPVDARELIAMTFQFQNSLIEENQNGST